MRSSSCLPSGSAAPPVGTRHPRRGPDGRRLRGAPAAGGPARPSSAAGRHPFPWSSTGRRAPPRMAPGHDHRPRRERPQARRPVAGGDPCRDPGRGRRRATGRRHRQRESRGGPERDRDRHRPPPVPERDGPTLRDPAALPRRRHRVGGRRRSGPTMRRRPPVDRARQAGTGAGTPGGDGGPSAAAVPDADLVDLDAFVGRTVRVGGLVVDLASDGFTLDDGTATGRVVLSGAALDLLAARRAGRRHQRRSDESRRRPTDRSWSSTDPGGVILAGDPVAAAPSASADPAAAASPAAVVGSGRPDGRRAASPASAVARGRAIRVPPASARCC